MTFSGPPTYPPLPGGRPSGAAAPVRPRRSGTAWWGALGGAALIATVVIGLTVAGVVKWGSPTPAGGTATGSASTVVTSTAPATGPPVQMPDRAGPYVTLQQATATFTAATKPSGTLDAAESSERLTAEAVGEAYRGAAVGVRSYATADLLNTASAFAVRAPSPLLEALPAQDAELLGLGAPVQEVIAEGDVRCLVNNGYVAVGKVPDPDDVRVLQCQRTGQDLTVVIFPSGDLTATQVAGAVDGIWAAASR